MKGSKVLKDLNEVVPGLTKRNERSSKQRGTIGSYISISPSSGERIESMFKGLSLKES